MGILSQFSRFYRKLGNTEEMEKVNKAKFYYVRNDNKIIVNGETHSYS